MEPGVLRDGRVQLHPQRHARQLTLQLFQVYSFGSYKHVPVPGIAYPTVLSYVWEVRLQAAMTEVRVRAPARDYQHSQTHFSIL